MWKRVFAIIGVLFLLNSPSVLGQGVLVASGHPEYPPSMWQEGNKIVGIGAELTKLIFEEHGITVQLVPFGNWKRVQQSAKDGKIDVIVGAYINEERKAYMHYPVNPYMDDPNVLWVLKGHIFPYNKWDDLISKEGAATLGESFGQDFDKFIKEKLSVSRVSKISQVFKLLEQKHVEYAPFGLYAGKIQAKKTGYHDKLEYIPKPVVSEGLYITLSKKSLFRDLLPQLEEGIMKYKENGTVEKLIDKYMNYYLEQQKIKNK
ncbi:substrate-binding periplasmic protein [Algicola sagamiensis]|uniref:substrate-binding periplasmic protein n=1 Tax=Algicola sagamiensis TaxID=163869 RepID=UPI000377190E|nr:transporter substrate-binding domain-containing protein [Algicola sagamiensis]